MAKKSTVKEIVLKASDPLCSSDELDSFAGQSVRVDRLIAAHPNTSVGTLLALANEYPVAFLSNPRFSEIFKEDPERLCELWSDTVEHLVAQPQCPESFANLALIHYSDPEYFDPAVLNGYLKNPSLTIGFIERILSLELPCDLTCEEGCL